MVKNELKETRVSHSIGELKMNIYYTRGVQCHWHDEYEFILPQSDKCECIIEGERHTVLKGEALLVSSGELHSVILGEKAYAITFNAASICGSDMLKFFGYDIGFRRMYSASNAFDAEIISILQKIIDAFTTKNYGYELIMKSGIIYILGKLFENGSYHKNGNKTRCYNAFLTVLEYVNGNYGISGLTIDRVSSQTNFSRSYISRLFKVNTGLSFSNYLNNYRIDRASELLVTTDKSILEISLMCGYENVSYFIQLFKKQSGTTPYKYRKMSH